MRLRWYSHDLLAPRLAIEVCPGRDHHFEVESYLCSRNGRLTESGAWRVPSQRPRYSGTFTINSKGWNVRGPEQKLEKAESVKSWESSTPAHGAVVTAQTNGIINLELQNRGTVSYLTPSDSGTGLTRDTRCHFQVWLSATAKPRAAKRYISKG